MNEGEACAVAHFGDFVYSVGPVFCHYCTEKGTHHLHKRSYSLGSSGAHECHKSVSYCKPKVHNGKKSTELKYLRLFSETLRKYPPVPLLTRECTKTTTLQDTDLVIEKGLQIMLPIIWLISSLSYRSVTFSAVSKSKVLPGLGSGHDTTPFPNLNHISFFDLVQCRRRVERDYNPSHPNPCSEVTVLSINIAYLMIV